MKKNIFFVRHGESLGNLDGPLTVLRSDIVLSDNGIAQSAAMAEDIGALFRPENFEKSAKSAGNPGVSGVGSVPSAGASGPDLIIVSPYLRAVQTAHPLFAKFPEIPTEIWSFVHEFEPACSVQGKLDRLQRFAIYDEYFARDDHNFRNGTDGETFAEFIARVDRTIAKLRETKAKNIVIVTHYWFINAMLMRIKNPEIKLSPKYFNDNELAVKNTEIIKIEL